jgi:DNA segregation ATPase FtsK/SpoIIIE, S-DNA-T family
MSVRRPWRLDLAACLLLGADLLAALAVLSFDPADLPGPVYPQNPTPRNVLGSAGAWLGGALVEALGLAAHVLLATWFVLVVLLLLRRGRLASALRLAGWVLLVPCATVLADRWAMPGPGAPLSGSGGSIGAWLGAWLESSFRPAGQVLVLGSCVVLSLALAIDFVLLALLRLAWRFGRLARAALSRAQRRLARRERTARPEPTPVAPALGPLPTDVEAAEEEPGPPEPPAHPAPEAPAERPIPIHHHDQVPAPADADHAPQVPLRLHDPALPSERERFADYELPPLHLLEDARPFSYADHDQQLRDRAALLEKTFADFGLNVKVVGINTGPVITQFEVALETGLRLHKVTRLADDIALNLKAASVRMVAPIPGKNTVGVEVPNEMRADVRLKEVILAWGKKVAKSKIPLFLGKDSEGRPLVYDLADMPHLLIAGSTGTGKSVCLNAIILSMLMLRRPDEVKLIMIDPKNGVELDQYGKVPHLMHPIVTDMKKAEAILAWAVDKMEERYDLLRRARVRNVAGYNELGPEEVLRRVAPDEEERPQVPERLPYIVIVVDEMADLMMLMKKEVEGHIIRLAQKSRAAGIHLVVATQKPTVDVITGLIKSNLPARVCFKVVNKSDSRVVLDEMGADKLLGKGDMLFLQPGTSTLVRAQGTYASDEEIRRVVEHLECDPCYAAELIQLPADRHAGGDLMERLRARDELYEAAIEVILREGRGSVSLLQRALGIGYGRAARLIDFMAEDGIVGSYNGSNAREVLYTPEQWAQLRGDQGDAV